MSDKNNNNKVVTDNIINFVNSITEKNYAAANKYLQFAADSKLKRRIKSTATKLGF